MRLRTALILLVYTLLAAAIAVTCPAQTTSDKISALSAPPLWRVNATAHDAGGNPHTRLTTATQDTAWASGDAAEGDTLRTWLAYIDGTYYVIDPFSPIATDSLYALPPGMASGLLADSVAANWEGGTRWIDRFTMMASLQRMRRLFNP